jgi:LPS sulfotransferase NodH
MWPQILDGLRPRVAGDMHPTHSEIGAFLSTLFPSLHYIRLSRENKLLQAISYLRAEQTGVWSVPSAMPSRAFTSADQPRFNRRRISELMLQIQAEEDEIDRLLACTSNPAITITYEDLARDYHDTVARVLGFLELRSIPPINTIKPRLRRQTDLTTSRWVRRFLEQK